MSQARRLLAVLIPAFLAVFIAVTSTRAAAFSGAPRGPLAPGAPRDTVADPLVPMLGRLDQYFRDHETDGVTLDARYDLAPSEVIRLSVVCQLLGYAELERSAPLDVYRDAIRSRATYLVPRFDQVRSGSVFDGMLGYAFLEAFAFTGDSTFLARGHDVVDEILAMPPDQTVLNGGLMGALALARWAQLTGDAAATSRAHDILASLAPYQNPDGSFPHWCWGSTDVHYTAWMSMELIVLGRMLDDPAIAPTLRPMLGFLEERIDTDGRTHYEGPCSDSTGCTQYYYSIATGCTIDYDTRAFTNEEGYTALLFDTFGSTRYGPVIRFLRTLERGGTFADKWDFWPPPSDPYYPWTIADTSVVNMSVLFWSLAATWSGRTHSAHAPPETAPGPLARAPGGGAHAAEARASATIVATPSPARAGCALRFTAGGDARVMLDVLDAAGRRVRRLVSGTVAAGAHLATWDLRDDVGARVAPGVYFARLALDGRLAIARIAVVP